MNQDMTARLEAFRRDVAIIKAYRGLLASKVEAAEKDVSGLRYRADLNQRSSEIIKKWLEDLLEENVNSIADLATSGLRHIIQDQNLTFRIKQEIKYNRLSMRFILEEDGVEADPMSSFGGGAVLVASFILRLAMMSRLKMANLLLLDESMSALAVRYIPAAAEFMRQLSEKTGVNILMVTHNEEFIANAHRAYEGYSTRDKDGLKVLHLRKRDVRWA